MSIQGCAHGSRVIRFGRPRASVRTHLARARVPCRIDQTRVASAAGSTRVISMLHVMARDFEALADQLHLRAHTCVLQRKSIEGCTLGSTVTRVSPTRCCCEHTHVYCRNQGCTQMSKFYQGFADQLLLRADTCVLQTESPEGCTQGSRLTSVRPTNCCREHTHASCQVSQTRAAPKDQGFRGFARPIAAATIHMCVAEQINSGLHPRVDMFQGFGRPGAAASTRAADGKMIKLKMSPKKSTVTKVWPTTCCCGHTHVCCRINQRRVAPGVKVYEGLADQTLLGAHTCMCCRTDEFRNSGLHPRF